MNHFRFRYATRSTLCLWRGAGGVGGEENWDTKRKRKVQKDVGGCTVGVRGSPVEGEREEGGKTTLTQYELIMQHWIASDSKLPMIVLIIQQLPYPLSLLKSWFFDFFGSSKITFLPHWNRSVFPTFFPTFLSVIVLYMFLSATAPACRRTLGMFWPGCLWFRGFQPTISLMTI